MRAEDVAPRTWLLGTVAGWALLIWLLALVGMGRSVGKLADDPSLQPALPELRRSPPPRLGPFTQYSEIVSRPLFSDDRRPKPFSLQPEGEGENTNAFDFVLTSVMLTPGLRLAILQPSAGGDSIRIKEGESAEQAANWRLVSVAPRSATFEGPEGQRTLDLRAFDGSGGQPATPSGAVAGSAAAGAAAGARARIALPQPPPGMSQQPGTGGPVVQVPRSAPPQSTQPQQPSVPDTTSTAQGGTAAGAVVTPEAQIEAIRKRIQARREQLRREAQQAPPANNP